MEKVVEVKRLDTEYRHWEFARMLGLPLAKLFELAADRLTEGRESIECADDDPTGEWTAVAGMVKIAENSNAEEYLKVLVTKRSVTAAYGSRYKGVIGQVAQPVGSWAISLDLDGEAYYWDKKRHGDTESLFSLAGTDCDELMVDDGSPHVAVLMMKWYVAQALYTRANPEAAAEFANSTIPPFDLASVVGAAAGNQTV